MFSTESLNFILAPAVAVGGTIGGYVLALRQGRHERRRQETHLQDKVITPLSSTLTNIEQILNGLGKMFELQREAYEGVLNTERNTYKAVINTERQANTELKEEMLSFKTQWSQDRDASQADRKKLQEEITKVAFASNAALKEANERIKKLELELSSKDADLLKAQETIHQFNSLLKAEQEKVSGLTAKLDGACNELAAAQQTITVLAGKIHALTEQVVAMQPLQDENKQLKAQNEKLKQENAELKQEILQLTQQIIDHPSPTPESDQKRASQEIEQS